MCPRNAFNTLIIKVIRKRKQKKKQFASANRFSHLVYVLFDCGFQNRVFYPIVDL